MKSPLDAIEQHFYSAIGNTFTADGQTFTFYTNPPNEETDYYAWLGVDVIEDDGTKDDFITECLAVVTIVDNKGTKYTSNKTVNAATTVIGELLVARGQQSTVDGFNLVTIEPSGIEASTEWRGQQAVKVRKLLLRILAEQL